MARCAQALRRLHTAAATQARMKPKGSGTARTSHPIAFYGAEVDRRDVVGTLRSGMGRSPFVDGGSISVRIDVTHLVLRQMLIVVGNGVALRAPDGSRQRIADFLRAAFGSTSTARPFTPQTAAFLIDRKRKGDAV
jgi:hypothetical protein